MTYGKTLASAVEALHQAYIEVRKVSGGQTDAVLHLPTGATYLFPETQRELRRMERTERLMAEERAAILDALPAHMAILDESGTIIAVNEAWRAFARAQSYPDATAGVGLNYLSICDASNGEQKDTDRSVAEVIEQILRGQSVSYMAEYACVTPDAVLWFLLTIVPLHVGVRKGAVVMHLDNTDRHAARVREIELLGRIERLMDQAGIGILVHRNHVPVFANPALAQMLGFGTQSEILAVSDIRTLFNLPVADEITDKCLESAHPDTSLWPPMVTLQRKDGRSATFEVRPFPMIWESKPAVCTLFSDVTEKLVIESQLRASQKLEAVGQLTAGVAHDFNNLLTVILGSVDLLHDALQDRPELARLADQAIVAAERGADLTKRLLAFAMLQPLRPQATDVNMRLMSIHEVLQRTLGDGIKITMDLSDELWLALVDPGELDNAVLNLSINARDAMPDGGCLLFQTRNIDLGSDAGLGQGMVPGPYVMLSVTDDGTGMSKATLERIFEPFFTTKDVSKGSGLGLSMVFGFVKQSLGQIKVRSVLDQGTTVELLLPRAPSR